jgi:thiamine biosynthesis protein ThiS
LPRDFFDKAMQIILNGEARAAEAGLSVEGLLRELGIDSRKVAVERNLEIVPKSAFATTALQDGDRLEIVHFIGGG